ncbi:MAG: hypothetical protein QOE60_328 [Thermoleophilaceae bacterium]|nr:hypothetical protein [Thermoleophilaceae bacterium]
MAVSATGAARGKRARKRVPRSSHGDWTPAADRPSAREILAEQDEARVPDLVPIRYGRMLASPFSFFRGAAAIMASDLGRMANSGLEAQLCGDAHLSNFGVFQAPDRRLVFDVDDFDETLRGPFEWDVKRLAASFAVAGRERGCDERERRDSTRAVLQSYREAMRDFADMRDIDVWYARFDIETYLAKHRSSVSRKAVKALERELAKARHKDSLRALSRLCHKVDGRQRIVSDPPLVVPIEEMGVSEASIEPGLQELLVAYRDSLSGDRRTLAARYRYVHAAHKVVGVGSVGARAWIILLLGRDSDDPLFLQAKEANRSVLEPFAARSPFDHQGRRVVEGQRMMQAASDIFLGWVRAEGIDGKQRDLYVRQLWDGKRSAEVELMGAAELARYGRLCGWTLARAHARSGDRAAIAGYIGRSTTFDESIGDFAEAYAEQNEHDYDFLRDEVEAGRLAVREGL